MAKTVSMKLRAKHLVLISTVLLVCQFAWFGTLALAWIRAGRPRFFVLLAQGVLSLIPGFGVLLVLREQGAKWYESSDFYFLLLVFIFFCYGFVCYAVAP